MTHPHFTTGLPCDCGFTRHLGRVSSTVKVADKLHDFLMNPRSRPDLQTPRGRKFLETLDWRHNDKTDPLMPWLTREWKKGRLRHHWLETALERHPVGRALPSEVQDSLRAYHADGTQPPAATGFDTPSLYDSLYGQSGERNRLYYPDPELNPNDFDGRHVSLNDPTLDHWGDFLASNHPLRREMGDIMQHQLPAFHQRVKAWDEAMEAEAHQQALDGGRVVHQTPDGWTVRQLTTPGELKAEGESMGHCVGSYGDDVARGRAFIHSLRDPQGVPHATTEIRPTRKSEAPPFDIDRALANHSVLNRAPERLKDMLRAYAKDPNWSQIEDMKPDVPEWDDVNEHSLGQLFNQLMARDREDHEHPIPHGGEMVQIQGKGNEEPRPEYKARLKDWLSTFSDEDRPQWGGPQWNNYGYDGDLADPSEIEDSDLVPGERLDDYGLREALRAADYPSLLEGTMDTPRGAPMYDPGYGERVYQLAKARGEIPDLGAAYKDLARKQQDSFNDLVDMNPEYLDYPQDEVDEDSPEMQAYYERERHLMDEHPGMQAANHMGEMLAPHAQGDFFTNEVQPQQQPEAPEPEWQPQTFAKTAAVDLHSLPLHPWLGNELDNPRFRFNYLNSENDWGGLQRHDFEVAPANAPASHAFTDEWGKTKRYGYDPELVDPDDTSSRFGTEFRWKGHPEWRREMWRDPDSGDEGGFREDIPADPNLIYRGLSHEEWENAKRTGQFQSNGEYNIGGEPPGSTLFSTDPDQARSYATGFAPWQRKPGFQTPSYVIATPRTPDAHPHPGMSADTTEIVKPSPTPLSAVTQAWQFKPQYIQHGDMLVRSEDNGQSYFGRPSVNGNAYAYRPIAVASPVTSAVRLTQQLYKRWVFSPATGVVTLADNSGDPLDVKYHTDLAADVNEPHLEHGYAYPIDGGWRLTDWDAKPVSDPFVIASVMRALKASEGRSVPHSASRSAVWDPSYEEDWSRLHAGLPS